MAKGLTAPFDPSLNIEGDNNFSKKGFVWRDRDVKVGKTVQLQNVVIGKGSVIADGVSIKNSIIGRNCQISGGAIADSVLWDNITVNSGCEIHKSVILSDNDVLKDVHLGSRTIILAHTQLPEATKIPDNARFTVYTATGQPLVVSDDNDDADEDEDEIPIDTLNLSDSDISEIGSDSDADSDTTSMRRRRRSSASGFSDAPSTNQEFYTEAEESLSRAFLENHSVENAMIELKTLRMATNVTFHEVREAIISSLMNVYLTTPGIAAKLFKKWGGLLRKFEEDLEAELDSVMIMQRYFAKRLRENVQNPAERNKFVLGLQGMYNSDVFTEKTIFRWFADERAKGVGEKGSEDMLSLRNASQKLITWLEEADEDSSEEEESDEE
jgi:translation initiation factor eIF-2B subunit epsilon